MVKHVHGHGHDEAASESQDYQGDVRHQLERGLFWYRHHPKKNELVSDRSSRADCLTDLGNFSERLFGINMVENYNKLVNIW